MEEHGGSLLRVVRVAGGVECCLMPALHACLPPRRAAPVAPSPSRVIDRHLVVGLYPRFANYLVPQLQGRLGVRILDIASARWVVGGWACCQHINPVLCSVCTWRSKRVIMREAHPPAAQSTSLSLPQWRAGGHAGGRTTRRAGAVHRPGGALPGAGPGTGGQAGHAEHSV